MGDYKRQVGLFVAHYVIPYNFKNILFMGSNLSSNYVTITKRWAEGNLTLFNVLIRFWVHA